MRTFIALLLLAFPLLAQTPYLIKDINTAYPQKTASSQPGSFVTWRDRTYFAATLEHESGTELWSTDRTSGGTSIVADLIPGSASSNPESLTVINDVLLFTARSVDHGVELWTTDGTEAGTRQLLDINRGPSSAEPAFLIADRNRLYFTADNGTNGRELWITDGTAAGTRLLADLEPGPAPSSPQSFVSFRNGVYFLTSKALWKTDGTTGGTRKVTTVIARGLTAAGSHLFFEGFTAATNFELWVSDGTEGGTRMLPEILPGGLAAFADYNNAPPFAALNDRVLFAATDNVHGRELWVSDGTAAGTHMVRDAIPGATGLFEFHRFWPLVFANRAWFPAADPEHGRELWSSDGTAGGTAMFFDAAPGALSSFAWPLGVAGGKLLFSTDNLYKIAKLWATDGTAAGTRRLSAADGSAVAYYHDGFLPRISGGYFGGWTRLDGTEPWITDGTDAGTRMIANLAKDRAPGSLPRLFAATDDLLFFHATEGPRGLNEASLWRTDGTEAGTYKLRESGQHPPALSSAGQYVFFTDESQRMLSDGTLSGTKAVTEFEERFGGRAVKKLYPLGSTLFAGIEEDRIYETVLWKTRGVPNAPAVRLGARNPSGLVDVAGHYLLFANGETSGRRGLWITDGTPAGTYAVAPECCSAYDGLTPLAAAAGMAWFLASRGNLATLFQSDGSVDGTVAVTELPISAGRVQIQGAGDRLFFITQTALWTSDGTVAGTRELAKTTFSDFDVKDLIAAAAGDRVVFIQYNDAGSRRHELWGSDGTVEGTKLLAALKSVEMASIDGLVYFAGTDDAHGTEVWTTDGTLEGTKLFLDLNPGPTSSTPEGYTKVGNTLYFSGYTEATGQELWALPLNEPRVSVVDARAFESASVVRFTVSLAGTPLQAVTLDYATSDVGARAGQDYEAASGTLTFAPGEAAKTIDVRVLGDTAVENNERFRLALHNVSGARVVRGTAMGIVDDDDAAADLSLALELRAGTIGLAEAVLISNAGPSATTDAEVVYSSAPGNDRPCWNCVIPQIRAGSTAASSPPESWKTSQVYRSAVVKGRQPELNPSNNVVSWTVDQSTNVAMSPAFLTPGATATVSVRTTSGSPPPVPYSSDPTIVSISSGVTKKDETVSTYTVTGLKPGTSTITLGGQRFPLLVNVVATGTPRWPGGLTMLFDFTATSVHRPVTLSVIPHAHAPFSGATATGLVTVSAAGLEIARRSVTGKIPIKIPLYFGTLESVQVQVSYSGDANFLPQTLNHEVFVYKGAVTVTGALERDRNTGGAFALRVRVEGAPGIAPTGTISVFHESTLLKELTLETDPDGTATAETTLSNLPDSSTLTLRYSGDALYEPTDQQVRLSERRRRNVRH